MSFEPSSQPETLSELRSDVASEVQFNALVLPAVLPDSFDALKSLLVEQRAADQMATRAAVQSTIASALQFARQQHQDELGSAKQKHQTELGSAQQKHQTELDTAKQQHQLEIAAALARHHEQLLQLVEEIRLERHRRFGSSSEQLPNQSRLFDEAEVLQQIDVVAGNVDTDAATDDVDVDTDKKSNAKTPAKARGKRSPLPPELERFDIVHDVPEAERICPCGTPMVLIGQDVSEQLDIVPMQIRVLRTLRKRYGCPGSDHPPVVAALPPQPLPKSNASPDFLAMLTTVKFVDGLPLARFEHVLARHHMPVPRQTLARWIIKLSGVMQPLYNAAQESLLESDLIYMDETPVQVLKGTGKAATSDNYMWVRTGGPPSKTVVLFDYDPSRKAEVPTRLLADWRGYLMTDGYAGYGEVASMPGVEHLACWAHARRYFVQARQVEPKNKSKGSASGGKRSHADEAIALIGKLYAIERSHHESKLEDRYAARQSLSKPILETLYAWLQKVQPMITPQSKLGKALAYLQAHWSRLIRYTERADLPIDNNKCENAIRPFVIGRKAWLFSDTTGGAKASAILYSLVETAKANGLEPYTWLRHVLAKIASAKTADDYEALMPWNVKRIGPLTVLD